MVYAIARQESAFNPAAVSSAGARGLLQLMPATARVMAKVVGLPYSQARLTSDPAYNAALGAAFLGRLHDSFGGSFVMTFAAYNAGPAGSNPGSRNTAIPAIPMSMLSTGSSAFRSPRPATTCSGSWRTCRSTAPASARRR